MFRSPRSVSLERLPAACQRCIACCSSAGAVRSTLASSRTTISTGHHSVRATDLTFRNLVTSHDDELSDGTHRHRCIANPGGEWPWSFYCCLEGPAAAGDAFRFRGHRARARRIWRGRPVPGLFRHVDQSRVPGARRPAVWNDRRIGVVEHVFRRDGLRTIDEFRAELHSARFDEETRSPALTPSCRIRPSRQGSKDAASAPDRRNMSAATLTKVAPAASSRLLADVHALDRPRFRHARSTPPRGRART